VIAAYLILCGHRYYCEGHHGEYHQSSLHNAENVSRKPLTPKVYL
jgi:hypothetical protein